VDVICALIHFIANREGKMPAELIRGDPDVSDDSPNEILNLSDAQNDAINTIISAPPVAAGPAEPQAGAPAAQFPAKNAQQLFTKFVLDSAGKEADNHVSRATDKTRVTEYLNLFGLDFADENGKPYAYCAAGLGFAACIGYCNMAPTESFGDPPTDVFRKVVPVLKTNYFLPHPSCLNMVSDAKAKGRWIEGHTTIPQPGWLVFYNWDGETGPPMHVGIVQEAGQGKLRTIEFNTSDTSAGSQSNGGAVARKNRDSAIRFVIGYEKTWDPAAPPASPIA
jgi:hypothetical protein